MRGEGARREAGVSVALVHLLVRAGRALPAEAASAEATLERHLAGVEPLVRLEVVLPAECARTQSTLELRPGTPPACGAGARGCHRMRARRVRRQGRRRVRDAKGDGGGRRQREAARELRADVERRGGRLREGRRRRVVGGVGVRRSRQVATRVGGREVLGRRGGCPEGWLALRVGRRRREVGHGKRRVREAVELRRGDERGEQLRVRHRNDW